MLTRPHQLTLGRISIHAVSMEQTLDLIEQRVASGQSGYVLTPNVDHVVLARSHEGLAAAYRDVFLSLPDGMPIVWASRLLGKPLPEKVSGSDLVMPLMERAAARGMSVYLLGGLPGSVEKAAVKLAEKLPALHVVGMDAPMISANADDEAAHRAHQRVLRARPDVLLVGLGCPKQELWIHRFAPRLPGTVSLGIGASIDFMAGVFPRAPRWMSQSGLEWLYRLLREPRRLWRRYLLRDPAFLYMVARMLVARTEEVP